MPTFFGDVGPLWRGQSVLSLSDTLLIAWGDGGSPRTVEWRKPTEPGRRGGGEEERERDEVGEVLEEIYEHISLSHTVAARFTCYVEPQ